MIGRRPRVNDFCAVQHDIVRRNNTVAFVRCDGCAPHFGSRLFTLGKHSITDVYRFDGPRLAGIVLFVGKPSKVSV